MAEQRACEHSNRRTFEHSSKRRCERAKSIGNDHEAEGLQKKSKKVFDLSETVHVKLLGWNDLGKF